MLAYLRQGETYADLAIGFAIGVTTVFCYIREALEVLAARAIGLNEAITIAARKALHRAAHRPDGHGLGPAIARSTRESTKDTG